MTNLSEQRKKLCTLSNSLLSLLSLQSLLQLQFLMAGTAAHLMQANLFLTFGTTAKARFAARLGTRSSLH